MAILTILTLQVPPDRAGDVVRYYASARILERSGALSARLGINHEDAGTLVVVATWPDIAAYETWQHAPVRTQFSQGVGRAGGGTVTATSEVYDVVIDT